MNLENATLSICLFNPDAFGYTKCVLNTIENEFKIDQSITEEVKDLTIKTIIKFLDFFYKMTAK